MSALTDIIDNLTSELEAKREESRLLREALVKISTAARRDISLSPPDPLLEFIVAQVDAAIAALGKGDGSEPKEESRR